MADATGTIPIVLWEKKIGCLQEDRCYKVENVHVKEFQGKKYLSVPDKCAIEDIDEIDDVAEMAAMMSGLQQQQWWKVL